MQGKEVVESLESSQFCCLCRSSCTRRRRAKRRTTGRSSGSREFSGWLCSGPWPHSQTEPRWSGCRVPWRSTRCSSPSAQPPQTHTVQASENHQTLKRFATSWILNQVPVHEAYLEEKGVQVYRNDHGRPKSLQVLLIPGTIKRERDKH
jgi:hypothetical protein